MTKPRMGLLRATPLTNQIVSYQEKFLSYEVIVKKESNFTLHELKIIWLIYYIRSMKLSEIVDKYNELFYEEESQSYILKSLTEYAIEYDENLACICAYEEKLKDENISKKEIAEILENIENNYTNMYILSIKKSKSPLAILQNLYRYTYSDIVKTVQTIVNLTVPINDVLKKRIKENGEPKELFNPVNSEVLRLFKYPTYSYILKNKLLTEDRDEIIELINKLKDKYFAVKDSYYKIKKSFPKHADDFFKIEEKILDQYRYIHKIVRVINRKEVINSPIIKNNLKRIS
jgi:hypothetical protein